MIDKKNIRKQLLNTRKALSSNVRERHSADICQHILASPQLPQALHVGVYLANKFEVNLDELILWLSQQHQNIYIPQTDPERHDLFRFAEYHPGQALTTNAYGVRELQSVHHVINVNQLDIIYVPLVGFTRQGDRLGQGGGHYDRVLSQYKSDERPLLIGVAFNCQYLNTLPTDTWDIPMDQIITESGPQSLNK